VARELQPDDPQSIGPYRLVGQLGQGGMGRVFLGVSPGGRPVAVKAIRAELAADPEFRARFGREVAAARRVSGVFTAQVVDADVDGPVAWMATAYVPGPSLAEAVDTHGPLPDASLLALAAGLAESLNAIHAVGVVHRDLKPSNVLLAEDGPRVIDFGISRATESTMLTQAGLVVGSPGFMSPEQAMGSDVGAPSDIFNLGAVLAFAATGEGPFGTGTTAALLYRVVHGAPSLDLVPPTVRPLIEHCLAKDPRQRPTANGLLAEVGALQPGGTWLPESFTRTYAQGTPSRPSFAWSGPVAAAAAGAAVAGSNPALAGTASAYAPPAGPSGPRTPAPANWPYTGAGALTATAGSAPPTPPMGAYPPATPPPMPPPMPSGTGRPPRRRMKPLLVALILGGLVGAGGAAAFALTSFTGQPSVQLEQPAGQTSSTPAPASVGPAVNSATTEPSASPSTSSPAAPPSQPTSTYSSPTTRATTTSPTTSPSTSPTTSPSTSASASASASSSSSAPASTSSSAAPPPSTPRSSSSASTSANSPSSPSSSAPSS
jgi:serine/threonine protein kinase